MAKPGRSLDIRENFIVVYLKEVREELKKVTWPTREEVIKLSAIVIVVSVIVSLYVSGLDYVFTTILGVIIK